MGCYLKRPQLPDPTPCEILSRIAFQWAATSNALSYEIAKNVIQHQSSRFQWAATSNALSYLGIKTIDPNVISTEFQWAATSNALSYLRRDDGDEASHLSSFNGLLPQTPSATLNLEDPGRIFLDDVSMGCYLKRPQLRARHYMVHAARCRREFQWAATSNALSYIATPHKPLTREY